MPSLPWQKRRVTRGAREAVSWTAAMLRENSGQGYFSYDQFSWGPVGFTDASKERRYCGGGWVNGEDGEYGEGGEDGEDGEDGADGEDGW